MSFHFCFCSSVMAFLGGMTRSVADESGHAQEKQVRPCVLLFWRHSLARKSIGELQGVRRLASGAGVGDGGGVGRVMHTGVMSARAKTIPVLEKGIAH
jgi:hypothetical protein